MSKRPFVIFGTFAVICLVVLPFWALAKEGSNDASPEGSVSASDQQGLELFQINCGACHTLAAAGTDGVVGPDLDLLLGSVAKSADTVNGNRKRVFIAVTQGVGQDAEGDPPGRPGQGRRPVRGRQRPVHPRSLNIPLRRRPRRKTRRDPRLRKTPPRSSAPPPVSAGSGTDGAAGPHILPRLRR